MIDILTTYLILAGILLVLLRFHPEGMEEDLLADGLVSLAWGFVLLVVVGSLTFRRRAG